MVKNANNGTHEAPASASAMLTLSKAAEYAGLTKMKLKAVIASTRFASIFNAETVKITHFHPDVPDLIEIAPSAIDAWKIAKEIKASGSRSTRNGQPRRYELRFTDDRLNDVNAALAPLGIAAVPLYKPKKDRQAASAEAPAPSALEGMPTAVADLIEAGDLVSA